MAKVEGIMMSANQRSRTAVAGETSDPSTPGVARGIPAGIRPSKRAMCAILYVTYPTTARADLVAVMTKAVIRPRRAVLRLIVAPPRSVCLSVLRVL